MADTEAVVVQCNSTTTRSDVYRQILGSLKVSLPISSSTKTSVSGEASAKAGYSLPFLTSAEASGRVTTASEKNEAQQTVGIDATSIHYLAEVIREAKKRVVIEDFHYLPEEEKQTLAFDLKAFWDLQTFFIIVGIWAEHNLLTYYNSDLSGRIDEIDVRWQRAELDGVLSKGEDALRIIIAPPLRTQMIDDANQNVGLL